MKTTYIQCKYCQHFTAKHLDNCTHCDHEMPKERNVNDVPFVTSFRSGYYEHIDIDPIYVGSRKQLKDETESRGLSSHYIH